MPWPGRLAAAGDSRGHRGNRHHGPLTAVGDHLAEHVAVDARQVPVQDDDVVGVEVELGRRLEAVVRGIHRHALIPQALDQHLGAQPERAARSGRSR